jgi:hypothetical protein
MPETFVLYAAMVPKPDAVEPEVRAIDWLEDVVDFIDTEAYALN